jgi:hypothetical protein
MTDRTDFEAYIRKRSPCANLCRQKEYLGGHYRTTTIQRAWELWQAARASAGGQWLPIESAPKDGTHILLANKAGVSEGGWLSDIDHGADWEGQIGMAGWWRTDGTDWPNTAWQSLPPPPPLEPK